MPFNSSTQVLCCNKDEFKKARLDPNSPPATWPAFGEAAKSCRPPAMPAASPRVAILDAAREFRCVAQRPVCIRGQRLRRPEHGTEVQQPVTRDPYRPSRRMTEVEDLRLWGTSLGQRAEALQSGMCDVHELVGGVCRRQCQHQGFRVTALLAKRGRRAAEFDHRRRHIVGFGWSRCGRIQRRCKILRLSLVGRGAGGLASVHRLSADYHGGCRPDA